MVLLVVFIYIYTKTKVNEVLHFGNNHSFSRRCRNVSTYIYKPIIPPEFIGGFYFAVTNYILDFQRDIQPLDSKRSSYK